MRAIHVSINLSFFVRVTDLLSEKKNNTSKKISATYLNNVLVKSL